MKSSYRNVSHLQLPINLVRTNPRIKILITRNRFGAAEKFLDEILHNRKLNNSSCKTVLKNVKLPSISTFILHYKLKNTVLVRQ